MFDQKLLKLARKLLPKFLLKRLDPFHTHIEESLATFAAGLPRAALVLDAGAGEANFRAFFLGQQYVAVDKAVGDPTWDYSRLSAVADLAALPFDSGKFDAVVSIVVLEHISDPSLVLSELRRVLRKHGRLFIAVPQFWELHQGPHDFYRYTRYGLEYLLLRRGFKILHIEPTGGYFHLVGKLSIDLLQFFQRGVRLIFFALLAPLFGFLIPLVCYYLDKLDRKKDFAVGFVAVAETGEPERAIS